MARRRKWTPRATILPKYSERSGLEGKLSRYSQPFLRHAPLSESFVDALWFTMGAASAEWRGDMTEAEARHFNKRWRRTERELGLRR
jgi:hypothetical protein